MVFTSQFLQCEKKGKKEMKNMIAVLKRIFNLCLHFVVIVMLISFRIHVS